MTDQVYVYRLCDEATLSTRADMLRQHLTAPGPGKPLQPVFAAMPAGCFRYFDRGRMMRNSAPQLLAKDAEAAMQMAQDYMRAVNDAAARYRAARDAETATPEATIRRAAGTEDRPSTAELLAAIVALPGAPTDRAHFFDRLAGGGSPGRRWKLVYTATADAVKAARKGGGAPSLGFVDRFTLKSGVYCDEFATAIQRFDAEASENENGIFELFGSDAVKFTVKGPFKWPDAERRAICAFRPTSAFLKLGPLEREWPLEAEEPPFDDARPTQLPFFKFLLVDDEVAVAQGRTGGVAVWARE